MSCRSHPSATFDVLAVGHKPTQRPTREGISDLALGITLGSNYSMQSRPKASAQPTATSPHGCAFPQALHQHPSPRLGALLTPYTPDWVEKDGGDHRARAGLREGWAKRTILPPLPLPRWGWGCGATAARQRGTFGSNGISAPPCPASRASACAAAVRARGFRPALPPAAPCAGAEVGEGRGDS